MMFFDDYGYPVDQTHDGGDSMVRVSILSVSQDPSVPKPNILDYYLPETKELVRHPKEDPWNFPGNFSRDQLMMSLMALNYLGHHSVAKEVFYKHAKRFFFCQNFYRDKPGTKKYLYPHKVDGKWVPLDFADILMFQHIGAMVIAGRVYLWYIFLPVFYIFHLIGLYYHSVFSKHHEENQMIAECSIYKTLKLYRHLNTRWLGRSIGYWSRRNEIEYHNLLKIFVYFNNRRGSIFHI